jgi:hypothetical protein
MSCEYFNFKTFSFLFSSLRTYAYFQVVRDAVEEELATIESLMNERKSFYQVDPSKFFIRFDLSKWRSRRIPQR